MDNDKGTNNGVWQAMLPSFAVVHVDDVTNLLWIKKTFYGVKVNELVCTGLPLSRQYGIPWLFQTKIKLYRDSETI